MSIYFYLVEKIPEQGALTKTQTFRSVVAILPVATVYQHVTVHRDEGNLSRTLCKWEDGNLAGTGGQ